jgi:3-hydroxyacyl-CoA dehydrogenase
MSSAFKKGQLSGEAVERRMGALTTSADYAALGGADLVVEAAFENMPLKRQIFARLDAACRPGALLASNTSNLSIDELAACTSRPQDVVGLRK